MLITSDPRTPEIRVSADIGLGTGNPNSFAGQYSISIDFLRPEGSNYRLSLANYGAGQISFCHDECPKSTAFETVMLYGGISTAHFSKYTGFLLSANLGVGTVTWKHDHSRAFDFGVKIEARAYLGPLYLFASGGASRGGTTAMAGIGLSTF